MKNNPVQFLFKGAVKLPGIISYPLKAYVNLTLYAAGIFGEVEGDDIRIIIVLQVLLVYPKQVFIAAKNIVQTFQRPFFLFKNTGYKHL